MKLNDMKIQSTRTANGPLLSLATAAFTILLSMPAISGITISDTPLQSSTPAPPNILFILDDSGSMGNAFIAPPDVGDDIAPTTNAPDIGPQTYARNSIYYNPAVTYTRWKDAAGNDFPDSVSATYATAFSSNTQATVASGTTNLNNANQNFYVPKNLTNTTLAYLTDPNNYYRWQIKSTAEGGAIVRGDTPVVVSQGTIGTTGNIANGAYSATYNIVVPLGASSLRIDSSGGTGTDAEMYVRFNATPTTGSYNCRSRNGGTNTESCYIPNPAPGTWQVRMYGNGGAFNGVVVTSSYATWSNFTAGTPWPASWPADQKTNYALWYSYHRTRNKVAKNGVGLAFQGVGADKRVGFTTIHGNAADTLDIPVGVIDGAFKDDVVAGSANKTNWFNKLYSISAGNSTPLRSALRRAGTYYSDTAATGPYGPESGSAQLACRKNFTILTTDGYWNTGDEIAGYAQADGDDVAGSTITGPSNSPYAYAVARPYNTTSQANTLADEAMYWWKTDLRTDAAMPNIVPVSTTDPAFWQHMVTFGISIGLQGTLNPTPATLTALTTGPTNWPDPIANDGAERIDDLWHATVNSRGTFVAATNPDLFLSGLNGALNDINARDSSNSNASANSTSLDDGSFLFQAKYTSASWDGELDSYVITNGALGATPTWSASGLIPTYVSGLRNILTWNGTAGATFPTATQSTTLTAGVANYIRGDKSNEKPSGTYRARPSLLGDIVNSSPAYDKQSDTIYVGANDGMLHAFNSVSGVERFAYVPAGINFTNLKTLSDPNYAHRYFVDGAVVVSTQAQTTGVSNFVSPNVGKNILVGALGRGGKGVFALDVTNPASMTAANVKWESATNSGMGNVLGRSFIAKLNNGVTGVIVANGPNSITDTAQLFIYDLNTGALLSQINTGDGPNNGLSSPIGWDNDNDGDVDYVYSGDLRGNMWKFDISSGTVSNWALAASRQILYTAYDAASTPKRQPITGRPTIARDPTDYTRWVFFGTGQFLTASDPASLDVQTWYGIKDKSTTLAGRSALQQRNITIVGVYAGKDVRGFEPASPLIASKEGWYVDLVTPPNPPGTAVGERMVGDQRLFDNILIAASIIPTTDRCLPGGRGFVNAIDAFTGTSIASGFFDVNNDGDFSNDVIGTGSSQVPIGSVDLGVGMGTNPLIGTRDLIQCGSGASCGGTKHATSDRIGRISWREILGN